MVKIIINLDFKLNSSINHNLVFNNLLIINLLIHLIINNNNRMYFLINLSKIITFKCNKINLEECNNK